MCQLGTARVGCVDEGVDEVEAGGDLCVNVSFCCDSLGGEVAWWGLR